jgi:hypothetical protein
MKNFGRLLLSALFIGVFGYMFLDMQEYPEKSALVPLVVAVPGLILSAAQFLLDLKAVVFGAAGREPSTEGPAAEGGFLSEERKKEFALAGWILVILGLILAVGFWVAIAVYVPLFMRFHGKESWKLSLGVGLCGWAAIFLVFHVLLGVQLFPGFLFELI